MILEFPTRQPPGRLHDPAVAPGRYRLKPVHGDWPTPEEIAASSGRLFVPNGGGAIRTIITGTKKYATGMQPSFKTRRRQYHEGVAELALIMISEVTPRIVDYQTQQTRFETVVNGKRYVHIADHMRELETGEIEIIEVKRDERDLNDPDYREKLAVVGEFYKGLRWTPRVILQREMFPSRTYERNIKAIYAQRFAEVTETQLRTVRKLRATRHTMLDLAEFTALLDPCPRRGRAAAFAMMVRRELSIELAEPITDASDVRILPTPKAPTGNMRFS